MKLIYLGLLLCLCACKTGKVATSASSTNSMNQNNPPAWIKHTNVYEVNVRQYTPEGTFNAFLKELPRLKDMGVETLWFMPITPIAQKGKKGPLGSYYAAADYTSINPEFGTLDDFKNLVKEAHAQGFKVIIDWVANHTGWDHVWTKAHPDWYEKDSTTGDFKIASGMDDIIELDFNNKHMRRAMIDAMKFWIEAADIDGFRADLAFWVELDFWQEAKAELQKVKPLFWLGELDALEHPDYMEVFDAAYTWTWMHKAQNFYQNKLPISSLDSVLHRYLLVDGTEAWFTTNHDENSWNGTEYEKYGEAAKAFAVFSCTWPGIPLLYSGQELPNHKRLKFFEKDPIEWNGNYALHDFYKTLLHLHSRHRALLADEKLTQTHRLHTSADEQLFAFLRRNGNREVLVILNLSEVDSLRFDLVDEKVHGVFKDVFSGEQHDFSQQRRLVIPAWGYLVMEK